MANPPNWMVNASLTLPFNDNPNDPYDTLAAKSRMLKAAGVGTDTPNHMQACKGFLCSDMANPGSPSAYKLGFGDVVDGDLVAHQKGIQTCAVNLARSDLPPDMMAQCKAVLDLYASKMSGQMAARLSSKANPSKWVVKASRDLPVAMTDTWDGPAAANRMLNAAGIGGDNPDYAKAARGFLVCDTANADLRGGYKLPFADIIGGALKADSSGLTAAAQRLPQTDIPDAVKNSAQAVLDVYKEKTKPAPKGIQRAYSVLHVKNLIEDQRVIEGIATTPTPDRSGDIVVPDGAQFQLPVPLLWQHDSQQPIGKITDAVVTNDGIKIRGQIASVNEPGILKDRLDEAWQTIKAGLVGGLSIGFKPLEEERIKDTFSYRIQKWLWLELSAVTIPANAEATITAIKAIDRRDLAAIDRKSHRVVRLSSLSSSLPGVAGLSSPTSTPSGKERDMKTVSEQIAALESTRAAKSAQMEAVMSRSIEEGRSTDASEREEFDTLEQDVEALDGDLKRLRSLEKSAMFRAREVREVRSVEDGANMRAAVQIKPARPKLEQGQEFAQFAICLAAGRGNLLQSLEIAKSRYGDNEELVGIMKNAVNAGTTTDPNWAGNLVIPYQRYTGDFVEFLRPQTIIGKFGVGGIPAMRRIPFNVSIVGQTSGGSGYWVGDGAPKPLTRFDFSATNLRWAKVANIAVITEELLRFAQPSADVLVRDALAAALIERLDVDFVDPNKAAVTNVSPASITFGVVAINSSGNSAADVRTDIAASLGQYIAANITPTNAVWILSARRALSLSLMRNALGQREFPDITMMGGMLEGIPVITSEYQHSDSDGDNAVLVNASDIWLADDGQVMLDASRETSLQMDDTPTMSGSPVTATTTVSMFQTNSVALRAERWINWQKRRTSAVVVLNAVNWGLDSGT